MIGAGHISRCLVATIIACALLCPTWPARADDQRHAWTIPGTLRIGINTAPTNLNPIYSTAGTEAFVESLVFDGLVYALPDGTIEPVLATTVPTTANGGISHDGLTITYHLRHDVHWQDGAPFTSADVAFTQAAIMNPANNVVVRQPYDHVVRIDTPDRFTVIVHLKAPYAPFVINWNASAVLPAHLLAGKHDLNNDPFNGAPIGTGAFRMTRWDRGNSISLTANPAYFDGPPGLQRIEVVLFPDTAPEEIAIRTHQIDWLFEPDAPAAAQLENDPDVRIERLDVNEEDGVYINVTRALMRDVRVRRALSLAIDRAGLAAKLGHGYLVAATGDIPSFLWAYDSSLRAPYDPARARALLDAAGWKPGADGIRTRNGTRLTLTYLFATGLPLQAGYAVQIAASLRAIGVDVQLKSLAPNILYASNGPGFGGDFDLSYTPWYGLPDPDDSQLFLCANVAPRGNNWSRWCNPEFEKWTTIALTHVDRATRKAAYAHVERVILDDVPEIVTDWRIDAEPISIDLRGFRDHDTYARPYRWSI